MTGRGHSACIAATIATASSSVGGGVIWVSIGMVLALGRAQSGTLPCLRRGSSSRLLRSIRKPATIF
ncbi:unannotated protein [freshwater metagenome]|uniref:Unannotated protein n=1 Tax=freshwater metagenome TaxID=449393 RepID=A0A6J6G5V7_9ZZZZ